MFRTYLGVACAILAIVLSACQQNQVPPPTAMADTPTSMPAVTISSERQTQVTPPLAEDQTLNVPYTMPLAPAVVTQALDIHVPPGQPPVQGWPIVILAHGFQQQKRDFRTIGAKIAQEGTLVYAIDWPTYVGRSMLYENGKKLREMTETVVCAVRYAHLTGSDFGGNPEQTILLGFSLGASMASLAALAEDGLETQWQNLYAKHQEPEDQLACLARDAPAQVHAFIGIAGDYGALSETDDLSSDLVEIITPSSHISSNPDLVVRLLHSPNDGMVPMASSEQFAAELEVSGYDVTLATFPEGHRVPHDLTLETIAEVITTLSQSRSKSGS